MPPVPPMQHGAVPPPMARPPPAPTKMGQPMSSNLNSLNPVQFPQPPPSAMAGNMPPSGNVPQKYVQ